MEFQLLISQLLVARSEAKVVTVELGWFLFPRKEKLYVFNGGRILHLPCLPKALETGEVYRVSPISGVKKKPNPRQAETRPPVPFSLNLWP